MTNTMNSVAIIQARMDSRRFPGKVLELIENKTMLWHIVTRLKGMQEHQPNCHRNKP